MAMETKIITKKLKDFTSSYSKEKMSPTQRFISIIGGAYMVWSAIATASSKKKTGVIGPAWNAISGSYLIYRGVSGHCPIKEALDRSDNKIITFLHKN